MVVLGVKFSLLYGRSVELVDKEEFVAVLVDEDLKIVESTSAMRFENRFHVDAHDFLVGQKLCDSSRHEECAVEKIGAAFLLRLALPNVHVGEGFSEPSPYLIHTLLQGELTSMGALMFWQS